MRALHGQKVALAGDNTAEPNEPDGLENTVTTIIATDGAFTLAIMASVQRQLKDNGVDARSLGAMCSSDVFEFLLAVPTSSGSDNSFIRSSNISSTGYMLVASAEDAGIPVGVEPDMTGGVMVIGDFSQSAIYMNQTVDLLILKTYVSDLTRIHSFLDYDFKMLRDEAFITLSGIV